MRKVEKSLGIEVASRATGTTIVVDTFRAFTTAASLFAAGVEAIYLEADVDTARSTALEMGALLCGEVDGRMPRGFDLGNSPHEVSMRTDLAKATIVQRTSAGTRSVLAALDNGARPVFAASAVVAAATARACRDADIVTIVTAGLGGVEPAEEDDATADHIAALLSAEPAPPNTGRRISGCERADVLRHAEWAHPGDVAIAADVDLYDFAMQAYRIESGRVRLIPRT